MKKVHLGAASLNLIPLDFSHNRAVISKAVEGAKARGVQVLCLPELALSGYGCEDAFFFPHVAERSLEILEEIKLLTAGIVLAVGLPLRHRGKLHNAVALCVDGKVRGFVLKQHLAYTGVYYENRWFEPWKAGEQSVFKWNGTSYPCGDLVFDVHGIRIGLEICEDAWVEDRPARRFRERGVDVILNPSASHFEFGKRSVRLDIIRRGSTEANAAYVYCNLLGNESGRLIFDGDCIIAYRGEIVTRGDRFSFGDYSLGSAVLEIKPQESSTPSVRIDTELLSLEGGPPPVDHYPSWDQSENVVFEEFTRAVALGLFDYMRKSRSRGFTLSLSGGADSGAVAILVYLMWKIATSVLTSGELSEKLSYWKEYSTLSEDEAMRLLLCCVYQSTENNSEATLRSAQELARGIGAQFATVQIQDIVEKFLRTFEPVMGRTVGWIDDDIALQNIQSRVRSPGIWLVANVRGSLLLTTSNRSEAVVGYCTMDGDTSGGLAPLAGVSKYFLKGWLEWVAQIGPLGLGPVACAGTVAALTPTAELRPKKAHQTDESDLMPYRVLDTLERATIKERRSPTEVLQCVLEQFSGVYPQPQLELWTRRFFLLWRTNQWKRERVAPSFHLDSFNVDPRSWCRFPILSGGLDGS